MLNTFGAEQAKDPLLLIARIIMMLLFVVFGWGKLTDYSGTIAYFVSSGVPFPSLAAPIAVLMEFGVGCAIIVGLFTRPLAVILGLYTLATALLGHHFWSLSGAEQLEAEINFFKNVSIMSGLFVLYVTGAGRYSLDQRLHLMGSSPIGLMGESNLAAESWPRAH
ncbi:MAG: DoxX family protein [Acetobacteraceae bacterium]